ncbi:MAG: radical SAM protein [Acidobacteriota bacterium]|nr:MAG: radical SAM protein [Acidobacteriota bacterium]
MPLNRTPIQNYEYYQQLLMKKGAPFAAQFEITYLCNLRCTYCYNPTHESVGEMTTENVIYILDQLERLGVSKVTFTGGECMAHPDFFKILEEAQRRQFIIDILTNGTLIDRAAAERLKHFPIEKIYISIRGDNAKTHEKETGVPGSFDKLLKAFEHLQDAPFGVEFSCNVTKANQNELCGIKAIADRYGTKVIYDLKVTARDNGDTTPLEKNVDDEFRRRWHSKEFDDLCDEDKIQARELKEDEGVCSAAIKGFAIDPYGNVFPCIMWRRPLGNILQQDIFDIWYGENATLKEVREVTVKIKDAFSKEDLKFAHPCAGMNNRVTGNPMEILESERKEIALRRERYLADLAEREASTRDGTATAGAAAPS